MTIEGTIAENRPSLESQYSVAQTIPNATKTPFNSTQIQEIPKKKLNNFAFYLNIVTMLFLISGAPIYYIFGPAAQRQTKGIVAGCTIGIMVIITFPTFFFLTTLKKLIQLAFLLDTIMVVTIAGVLAFVNLIMIFDKGGTWYFPLIQASFSLTIFLYSTIVRVLLVTLDWSKWQVIVFKLHLMINCLISFISGVYFIYVDFTYTNHQLKAFDDKVHQFMVLFIFTMFGWLYEIYSKVTDLDHTGDLKFIYELKNVDQTRLKKTKQIIKKRKESIHSIRLIEQHNMMREAANQQNNSIFGNIETIVING